MAEEQLTKREVDQFVLEEIDTVPHLEALLLLWNHRPKLWFPKEMAAALYISKDNAQAILQDLKRRGFAVAESERYAFDEGSGRGKLVEEVERTYRRELIRISRMIHSKPPAAVREFARAFKLKKD